MLSTEDSTTQYNIGIPCYLLKIATLVIPFYLLKIAPLDIPCHLLKIALDTKGSYSTMLSSEDSKSIQKGHNILSTEDET